MATRSGESGLVLHEARHHINRDTPAGATEPTCGRLELGLLFWVWLGVSSLVEGCGYVVGETFGGRLRSRIPVGALSNTRDPEWYPIIFGAADYL